MEYLDFAVTFEPGRPGEFRVRVSTPEGQARGSFHWEREELLSTCGAVGRIRRARSLVVEIEGENGTRGIDLRTLGRRLFREIFSGEIRRLYDRCRTRVTADGRQGLRIRLQLDPALPELAPLCGLPWELLDPGEDDFLGLDRRTPITRFLDVACPSEPVPFEPPLRVLVVVSHPSGVEPLNLGQEQDVIEKAWGKEGAVSVRFLPWATLSALREELISQPVQVLHFMGHGEFDLRTGWGVLIFETRAGQQDRVSGRELGAILRGISLPPLVVLNACETGMSAPDGELPAFAGVATALVKEGVPAVVAMQLPVSDAAAIAFSGALYRRLAAGDPVEAAVTEGRMAIHLEDRGSLEWGTPVLFLRASHGEIEPRTEETVEHSSLAPPNSHNLIHPVESVQNVTTIHGGIQSRKVQFGVIHDHSRGSD